MIDGSSQKILNLLIENGIEVQPGLNEKDFKRIESAFKAKLPEDYKKFLSCGVPTGKGFPDWSHPRREARNIQKWIDEMFRFDIEENNYWLDEFGIKPSNRRKATRRALRIIRKWPTLLPVYSHRFIPSEPAQSDSPVISLHQATDSIIYGANLKEYFINEFNNGKEVHITRSITSIPYWSKALHL